MGKQNKREIHSQKEKKKKKKKEEESIWFMVKWGLGSNAIALYNYPFLFSKKKFVTTTFFTIFFI